MLGDTVLTFVINLLMLIGLSIAIQRTSNILNSKSKDRTSLYTLLFLIVLTYLKFYFIGYLLIAGAIALILIKGTKPFKLGALGFTIMLILTFFVNHAVIFFRL